MTEALGKSIVIIGVFLAGMASMVLLERFGQVPDMCLISQDVQAAFTRP